MRNVTIRNWLRMAAIALAIGLLAACHRGAVKEGTAVVANVPTKFDITVSAAKDGQFDLDGLTLTRQDLASHLRYLVSAGTPAHSILLQPGEKEGIKQRHITGLAIVCRDEHVTGYVKDDDGNLKIISVVDDTNKNDDAQK